MYIYQPPTYIHLFTYKCTYPYIWKFVAYFWSISLLGCFWVIAYVENYHYRFDYLYQFNVIHVFYVMRYSLNCHIIIIYCIIILQAIVLLLQKFEYNLQKDFVYVIYIYLITQYAFLSANVKKYNSTTRHLRFSHISTLTNLLRTDNETKSIKTIYNQIS